MELTVLNTVAAIYQRLIYIITDSLQTVAMRLDSQSLLALVGITTTFVGITTGSVVVADAAQIEAAKVECGSAQNVMRVPEGADAAQYRTCIEHPLGAAAGPRAGESLVKRDCWYGANTGCTNGMCFFFFV
jgi:hypothetical protein